MGFTPGPSDPFIEFMRPPPDETPAQATARQQRELDAQRRSDAIDESIKRAREQAKKEKGVVKVLLLGQSESGKSTTLKNFRMRYSRDDWERERNGWRAVVQLNVVRSITSILAVLEAEQNGEIPADSGDEEATQVEENDLVFAEQHQLLMIRLAPLRGIEAELKRRLGAGAEPAQHTLPMTATPFEIAPDPSNSRRTAPEFSVRSWKDVLGPGGRCMSTEVSGPDLDSVTDLMVECRQEMKALWDDKFVRHILRKRKLRLPDSAGFFLNDLDRIASRGYVVSDNDIVRARLRTVGIQEHRLSFAHGPFDNAKSGKEAGWEWRIFDVGGCRTSRAAWLPFFDNVNVIIFLSPVSVFDQRLEEDPRVNRLEDSIILWTSICQSKLLAKSQLILFLNKCDLLRRKLKRGIQVKAFLPSYGDRPNEVIPVVKYLREKFKDIQKHASPESRSTYIYPTTVTDTEATAVTLESVRDGVLRENLASSQLI